MHIFYQPLLPAANELPEEEAKHCLKVLRHQAGDVLHITDGLGNLYAAVLTNQNNKKATFQIQEHIQKAASKNYSIHIAIAPTKNSDRLEWFLEKCIEFGIDQISLLQCRNSERSRTNLERLEKKAVSAMKQSLNLQMPKINDLINFRDFVSQRKSQKTEDQNFIAYVDFNIPQHLKDAAQPEKSVCVLIGPEGDFDPDEIEEAKKAGFMPVSLGKSRLRTETAGIAACHILNLINE